MDAQWRSFVALQRETATLTRPRFRVITSTKWEVNITMKYHVASFAMVSKSVVTRKPGTFDLLAHKVTIENARMSGACIVSSANGIRPKPMIIPTHHRRGRGSYTRPLSPCSVVGIRTGDMHRGVSLAFFELHGQNSDGVRWRSQ